jgi:outer membrane immunogenic protein
LRAGFVGGGVEWMFFPNWSLKAEALYYDLGTSRVSGFLQQAVAGGGAIIANTGPVSSWRNNGIIAHAGLNYHLHWFDAAPVVARY